MIDVLFVDDHIDLATELAEYCSTSMLLTCRAVDSPEEALRLAREDSIKVAVLDQRMPVPGVDLGEQLVAIDMRIRRVLLSGEATARNVTDAYNSGFSRHVHKSDALRELPPILAQLLVEYGRSLKEELAVVPVDLRPIYLGRWPWRSRINLRLIRIESKDDDFVPLGSWKTRAKVEAGQTIEEETTLKWEQTGRVQLQVSSSDSLSARVAVGKAGVKAETGIKSELTRQLSRELTSSSAASAVLRRTLTLAAASTSVDEDYCTARSYQAAPVYVRFNVSLAVSCECCGHVELMKADYLLSTDRFATRQVNYWSLSDSTTNFTGIETAG